MPGAQARTHGPVYKGKKYTSISHHRQGRSPRHSLRDGCTVSFVLFPEIGFLVSVVGAMRKHCCRLDASVEASEPHDFAVRFRRVRLARQKRPSHPAPNVRDDRDTPLLTGAGCAKTCQ